MTYTLSVGIAGLVRRAKARKPETLAVHLSEVQLSYRKTVVVRISSKKKKNPKRKQPPVVILKRRRQEIHQPYNFSFYFHQVFFPSMMPSGPSWPRQEGRKE